MSDNNLTERAEPGSGDPEAVRADIDRTRAELADTVDQLSDKLNVKAQASERLSAAKDHVSKTAGPHRGKIIAGVLAAVGILTVLRHRGMRHHVDSRHGLGRHGLRQHVDARHGGRHHGFRHHREGGKS